MKTPIIARPRMRGEVTPLMQSWCALKAQHPGALLLVRLGDFYEMFFQDARDGAKLLNVALTKRKETPMAGVPYHALDRNVKTLTDAGREVVIAELEKPMTKDAPAKWKIELCKN